MASLLDEIASLDAEVRKRLESYHFDATRLQGFGERLRSPLEDTNRVRDVVEPPKPEDISLLPAKGSSEGRQLAELGEAALAGGHCALVVLAGGMATRMGGVVKALVEALPERSFLDLRLQEQASRPQAPLWFMTSAVTESPLRAALESRRASQRVAVFSQELSLRLTPGGHLFRDEQGRVSDYAPGHGDLPDALKRSGLLERFVARGGRYVSVTNVDNLGAGLDPLLLGRHIMSGAQVTCEVVEKLGSDRGGIPVRRAGRMEILEEFRLPQSFDATQVRVFNTNTFHFDARALLDFNFDWTFFTVKKPVGDKTAIQFERLLGEVTSTLETHFVLVPRSGVESRFLPIKDFSDLEHQRQNIEHVAKARGMLAG